MKVVVSLLIALFASLGVNSLSNAAVLQTDDALLLNVTVTTKKGTVIRDLKREDFSVTVDDQSQQILSVTNREVPASIGILIDTSGSQGVGKSKEALEFQQQFKRALEGFFKQSNPDNEYFAIAFNSKTQLVQDWTPDYQSILNKFDSLEYRQATAMYDALRSGIEMMNRGRYPKHVLIMISDGVDNNSTASFKSVRDMLKGSDVVLYSVGLKNMAVTPDGPIVMPGEFEGERIMKELAVSSGGRALYTNNAQGPKAFNEVFELIALELRSQYQLQIAPSPAGGKRKWHKLKVAISKTAAEELVARTRQGYYR